MARLTSLCDSCFSPGACCKRIQLYGGSTVAGTDYRLTLWDDTDPELQLAADYGLPFLAVERTETGKNPAGRTYSSWTYSCPKLLPNGRCGDYENRPHLCRTYEPGLDSNCVHYYRESGDASVGLEVVLPIENGLTPGHVELVYGPMLWVGETSVETSD